MKHLMILVSILLCSFFTYENFNLRMENAEHVRAACAQNDNTDDLEAAIQQYITLNDKQDAIIDELIKENEKLAIGVLQLFELLQAATNMDQVT